jgi:hypothetical protein
MIDKNTSLMDGFGRIVSKNNDNSYFVNSQFQEGKPHGFSRVIYQNGDYLNTEVNDGKMIRKWK